MRENDKEKIRMLSTWMMAISDIISFTLGTVFIIRGATAYDKKYDKNRIGDAIFFLVLAIAILLGGLFIHAVTGSLRVGFK